MSEHDDENRKVPLRPMTTEALIVYYHDLAGDLEQARRDRDTRKIAYCESRLATVAAVLKERAVEAHEQC